MILTMFKCLVLLSFVGALVAYPSPFGERSQQDVEELKEFLLETKTDREMTLEEVMAQNPKASPWENSGKFQGDIVLHDEEIEEMVAEYVGNSSDSRAGLVNTRHRWPGAVVYYDIAANTFNQAQINMILASANHFHQTTCVRWVRRTNQRDYVLITGRPNGCYATVGYWQNSGVHTLNLAPNGCFNFYIVFHEMLHSVGFHHMHQTYNRHDWIWVNWQNVQNGMQHNFNVFSNQVVTMLGLPYEYASNQHYGEWAFSTNGLPTIGARFNTNGQMGQLTHVTGWDIWRLARLYNCPGAWRVQVDPADAGKPYSEEFGRKLREAAEKELTERDNNMMLDNTLTKEETKEKTNEEVVNIVNHL